jgi:hypothetical protein
MKFIPLTDETGTSIFINFNYVITFERYSKTTVLNLAAPFVLEGEGGKNEEFYELIVKETPGEIMAFLESED